MGMEKCIWDGGCVKLDARVVDEAGMAGEGGDTEACVETCRARVSGAVPVVM